MIEEAFHSSMENSVHRFNRVDPKEVELRIIRQKRGRLPSRVFLVLLVVVVIWPDDVFNLAVVHRNELKLCFRIARTGVIRSSTSCCSCCLTISIRTAGAGS
jgi:hypothetical protein